MTENYRRPEENGRNDAKVLYRARMQDPPQ